jgi:hypothetical protein
MSEKALRFQGTIYKIWMLRYVDVPEEIGRALERASGKEKHIPVVATVGAAVGGAQAKAPVRSARTTLVPAGAGRYRLQFNATLRKAAGADIGDLVGVELRVDRGSRAVPVPEELTAALKTAPKARRAFESIGPGTRRQLLLWFGGAKSPAVRQKRLARLMDILTERALLGRKPGAGKSAGAGKAGKGQRRPRAGL